MDKINVSLSITQLAVIANLVNRCNQSKELRNSVFNELKIESDKPFILSVLSNKLNVLLAESKEQ